VVFFELICAIVHERWEDKRSRAAAAMIRKLLERGLQQDGDF
jgi:hypothetical protein